MGRRRPASIGIPLLWIIVSLGAPSGGGPIHYQGLVCRLFLYMLACALLISVNYIFAGVVFWVLAFACLAGTFEPFTMFFAGLAAVVRFARIMMLLKGQLGGPATSAPGGARLDTTPAETVAALCTVGAFLLDRIHRPAALLVLPAAAGAGVAGGAGGH